MNSNMPKRNEKKKKIKESAILIYFFFSLDKFLAKSMVQYPKKKYPKDFMFHTSPES